MATDPLGRGWAVDPSPKQVLLEESEGQDNLRPKNEDKEVMSTLCQVINERPNKRRVGNVLAREDLREV